MKKSVQCILVTLAVSAGALLASCTSATHLENFSNEIKSEKLTLNTYYDKDDYTVLGTATGTSAFVWWNVETKEFIGDSGKYGYIYEPKELHLGEGIFVGTGKKASTWNDEQEALSRARLNANYQLIEEAYAMGGDSIFEPVYSVESITDIDSQTETRQYKVTVRAKVIQLKNK